MESLKVEMTDVFYLPKQDVETLRYGKALQKIRDAVDGLNQALEKFAKVFDQRFVMLEQDVWYDYATGLLLPKFEKYRCPSYEMWELVVSSKSERIANMRFSFAKFRGRLMTNEEAQILFDHRVKYPYRHKSLNKFDIRVAWMRGLVEKSPKFTKCCPIGTWLLTSDFSWDSQKGAAIYNVTKGMMMFLPYSVEIHVAAIPVYAMTEPHPLEESLSETERKNMRRVAATAFFEQDLWPEGLPKRLKVFLLKMREALSSYIVLDKKSGAYQVDEKKFRHSWKSENGGLVSENNLDKLIAEASREKALGVDSALVKDILLKCDYVRANLSPYAENVLTDLNAGHWELYEQMLKKPPEAEKLRLKQELPARPPALDIRADGICAIDFGTKSTTVVCRNQGEYLRRIGRGEYHKAPRMEDYENPTAVELRDLESFLAAYRAREGRPFTHWEEVTVSHTARNRLLENEERTIIQSVFSELKQWANSMRSGGYRMRDQRGEEVVLPAYLDLPEGAFDPIELYAYYLGLYINNMHRDGGIYLDYILSYPVKYSKPVRERIRQSFERGLKKSLPPSILRDEEVMEDFSVAFGASEPAAYAACALKELGKREAHMQPQAGREICYAVFDFGGGTTDFDYGVWRLPQAEDGVSWNYVIEHFGAGSDEDLGGEKLLNLIAYQVYQDNLEEMRKADIHFACPDGCEYFAGGELLLDDSEAAHLNRRRLAEMLRPIWEQRAEDGEGAALDDDRQSMVFFRGNETVSIALHIDKEKLQRMLKERIRRGVDNFFVKLWDAFKGRKVAAAIDILLAGNSCKSPIVSELFTERIREEEKNIEKNVQKNLAMEKDASGVFRLHLPLGTEEDEGAFDRRPTGKTGVAFGLLACYRGDRNIKVIDGSHSEESEAQFRYYLGRRKGDSFEVTIGLDVPYDAWAPFLDVESEDRSFSLYYSSEPRALQVQNPLSYRDVKYKKCRLRYTGAAEGESGIVYIRKKSPNEVEYVVSTETKIKDGEYLSELGKCELS